MKRTWLVAIVSLVLARSADAQSVSMTALDAFPRSIVTGSSLTITDTVNTTVGAQQVTVSYFLSADTIISKTDTRIGSRYVAYMAPGTSSSASTTVTVPTGIVGTRYVGAIAATPADATVKSDGRNIRTGPLITIGPDIEPPVITVTGVSDGEVATAAPTQVCYTAQDPNLLAHSGELDLLPFQGCTATSTAGEHALRVTASDLYGHTATETVGFILDVAPPTLAVTAPAGGSQTSSTSVEVVAIARDDVGITSVTANGISLTSGANDEYRGVVFLGSEGAHTIQIIATDVAGRTADTIIAVIQDTIGPELIVTSPGENAAVPTPFVVSGTVTGAAPNTLTIDGMIISPSAYGAFSKTIDAALGPRDIVVRAADVLGNPTIVTRHVTVNPPGTYYCYDGAGNMTARIACTFAVDCDAGCP